MSDNFDLIRQFAPAESGVPREFTDQSGNKHTFVIAKLAALRDYTGIQRKIDSREKMLKASKGKLGIQVPAAAIKGLEHLFTDAKALEDDKVEIYLTTDEEVTFATAMECCVREPEFTWAQAAMWVRVNGFVAARVYKEFQKINSELDLEEAKND